MKCDHQFQNMSSQEEANIMWKDWVFACPFCGQARTVNKTNGEINIVIKGQETPTP